MAERLELKFKDNVIFDGKEISYKIQLKYSLLYMKKNYLTPIDSIINTIHEYDIREAGFSVIKEFKLLPPKVIDALSKMKKSDRTIMIGKLQKDNDELKKRLPQCVEEARHMLFRANFIQESEVLSIKNDAIFIIGRKLKETKFGDHIEFALKNSYNLYHKVEDLECYYNKREERLDIKGLGDDIVKEHADGIVTFLETVYDYLILGRYDGLKKYLREFSQDYKSRRLPLIYYKEFNSQNTYRLSSSIKDSDDAYFIISPHVSSDSVNSLNIIYNYRYFILPMITRYLTIRA